MTVHTTDLGRTVIGCAIEVHSTLGPGLLESAYDRCLTEEFVGHRLTFQRQVAVPIVYKGANLDCGYRLDFVFASDLIVEVKAVERLLPIHKAQMLTYLRLMHVRQGLVINFNVPRLVDGVRSVLL